MGGLHNGQGFPANPAPPLLRRAREHSARRARGYGTPWTVEVVKVMLFALTPTAVPTFAMEPVETLVHQPPVFPDMAEFAMESVPVMSLLVKNSPPPNAQHRYWMLPSVAFRTLVCVRVCVGF